MAANIITTVASGIIGEYSHDWHIQRIENTRTGEMVYELYINGEWHCREESVAHAREVLVNNFLE